MCGIVGMAGNICLQDKKQFRDMLDVCQVRGRHSTGVIAITTKDAAHYVKRVGPPAYLFDTREYDDLVEVGAHKVLVGHCRYKTSGDVNTKNAHPFNFSNVLGVHNGTLKGCYSKEKYNSFDVDSEWLFWHLNEYGPEETFSQLPSDGAWACVWWDREKNTLNFIRNKERPLYFTHSKNLDILYWASEPWMFNAIGRSSDLWDGGEQGKVFYPLVENTWLSWQIDDTKRKPEEIFKMQQPKEIAPADPFSKTTYYHGSGASWGKSKEGKKSVNDPFQTEGKRGPPALIPGEKPTSPCSSNITVNNSSPNSVTPTALKNGTALSSSTTYQLPSPSSLSPPKNKGESCDLPKLSLISTKNSNTLRGKLVSWRMINKVNYITDNKTHSEWSEDEFCKATDAICCYCKAPIGALTEVSEIFFKNKSSPAFVCTTCDQPPSTLFSVPPLKC